ncbi:Hypothetical protein I595_1420 [Croceitalea dokdonensis DOKDO 023]|uniref:Membrane or secreted protein n=1 Tax=Croceitalea dokdonensis DOKDO 023 TaxID=1300341 RepID=A0A0P7AM48_9FLAO|nr:hypothetical protein [Croceitalea dokdonensis]KPM32993.1 Hypothetical protein I595_1420 [Croceitalea dokdonensis DOKDO 023]
MLKNLLLCFAIISAGSVRSQSLLGAWQAEYSENGKPMKSVLIFADGYQVATQYSAVTGAFLATNGGYWSLEGSKMTEKVEFDSEYPEHVGNTNSFEISLTDDTLSIIGQKILWKRVDDGTPGALQGAWLMSGRKRDGEIQARDTNRPRKTMKILSGTRFQWIAYNTETKEFKGTGGGTYTTVDGKYTETIEFFSRDDSRVGASLPFTFELIDGDWHHSGFSSKGVPLYEIWSLRKE